MSVEKAKDILVRLIVWDSAGSFESHRLDPLQYLQNHVFLIGFSIDSPASLENVEWKVGFLTISYHSRMVLLIQSQSGNQKPPTIAPVFPSFLSA